MTEVGFEPTPPERLEPKSSALDHSATLPTSTLPGIVVYLGMLRRNQSMNTYKYRLKKIFGTKSVIYNIFIY